MRTRPGLDDVVRFFWEKKRGQATFLPAFVSRPRLRSIDVSLCEKKRTVSGIIVHQFLLHPPPFSQYRTHVSLRGPQLTAVNSNNGSWNRSLSRLLVFGTRLLFTACSSHRVGGGEGVPVNGLPLLGSQTTGGGYLDQADSQHCQFDRTLSDRIDTSL